jgi:hypothetical protein
MPTQPKTADSIKCYGFPEPLYTSSTMVLEAQKKYMLDFVFFLYSTQTLQKSYQSDLVC